MKMNEIFTWLNCECGAMVNLLMRKSTKEVYCIHCAQELLKELEKESLEEKKEFESNYQESKK
jgi:hypothetical protein